MHKVIYTPNKDKVLEYREHCQTETCAKGKNINWSYSDAFIKPSCKHCQSLLRGRELMSLQAIRVLYHIKD